MQRASSPHWRRRQPSCPLAPRPARMPQFPRAKSAGAVMTGKPKIGIPATGDSDRVAGDGLSPARRMDSRRTDGAAALCPDEPSAENDRARRNSAATASGTAGRASTSAATSTPCARRSRAVRQPSLLLVKMTNAMPRRGRKTVGVSPRRSRHHDAGAIITAEHDPALDGAGSEHRRFATIRHSLCRG